LDLQKASENNVSGLRECASVEACIPQCSPQSSPTGKCIREPGAPAQRARAGTNLSGASAFHVFLPDPAPLKPCSQSAVMRSYSGATWGASASRGAAAGLVAGRAGANRLQPVEMRGEYSHRGRDSVQRCWVSEGR